MGKLGYTTIMHARRKRAGLTNDEYCLLDYIYRLSTNPKARVAGWCNASKEHIANFLDFEPRTLRRYTANLEKEGWLIKNNNGKLLATTSKWIDYIIEDKGTGQSDLPKRTDRPEQADNLSSDSGQTDHSKRTDRPVQADNMSTDTLSIENKREKERESEREKQPTPTDFKIKEFNEAIGEVMTPLFLDLRSDIQSLSNPKQRLLWRFLKYVHKNHTDNPIKTSEAMSLHVKKFYDHAYLDLVGLLEYSINGTYPRLYWDRLKK